jgi:hypothetical protein
MLPVLKPTAQTRLPSLTYELLNSVKRLRFLVTFPPTFCTKTDSVRAKKMHGNFKQNS